MAHSIISPAILYFGTPVVIISSENEDGTSNLCAISSAWWLGYQCMLGFASESKTPLNMIRTGHCVVNLPDDTMARHVNALATTTGSDPVSDDKIRRGYRFEKDKWTCAGLTPQKSDLVRPARVKECPVQMECELVKTHSMLSNSTNLSGVLNAIEVRVVRIHILDELRMSGHPNRVDPDKWRPMIMSFQELYGLRDGKLDKSDLANVEEEKYRALTVDDRKKKVTAEEIEG
ncbi:hypothetical protein EJ04DRAFT_545788 [Polyplosphaeria fusca]|uniref:Flavin reductase like domain-containing protein n=1 Tax=Polyplosphaeria fusca TaxID=682080 RepID=A0A9P4QMZ8_9PLEO|nr:hypothetical protein EJ04DRAFT_545788 [Polyplosphaeria fusca]